MLNDLNDLTNFFFPFLHFQRIRNGIGDQKEGRFPRNLLHQMNCCTHNLDFLGRLLLDDEDIIQNKLGSKKNDENVGSIIDIGKSVDIEIETFKAILTRSFNFH
ncbi:hypothetical protein KEM48_000157 [Puccinia striiformis f. sp. tritici PST-130]|nr:hypothetical protein KEM48_000157 [Puccinia striiformis f. sp. tritici PST-130]